MLLPTKYSCSFTRCWCSDLWGCDNVHLARAEAVFSPIATCALGKKHFRSLQPVPNGFGHHLSHCISFPVSLCSLQPWGGTLHVPKLQGRSLQLSLALAGLKKPPPNCSFEASLPHLHQTETQARPVLGWAGGCFRYAREWKRHLGPPKEESVSCQHYLFP